MMLQQEVQGHSRDTSMVGMTKGSGEQAIPSLFFQLQEMIREETVRTSRSIPGSRPGVTEESGLFLLIGYFAQHQACW